MYGLVAAFDNGGETTDRYTLIIENDAGEWYGIYSGDSGNYPNGVFMSFGPEDVSCDNWRDAFDAEDSIDVSSLPAAVARSIAAEVKWANDWERENA